MTARLRTAIYILLMAPPVDDLDRGYSLDEVRHSYSVFERMRRVDLDAVNFGFGSWEVGEDQYPTAREHGESHTAQVLDRSPDGSLPDRRPYRRCRRRRRQHRCQTGARNRWLSFFRTCSMYRRRTSQRRATASSTLKVPTEEPSRINRRVSVRRITPLLAKGRLEPDRE